MSFTNLINLSKVENLGYSCEVHGYIEKSMQKLIGYQNGGVTQQFYHTRVLSRAPMVSGRFYH